MSSLDSNPPVPRSLKFGRGSVPAMQSTRRGRCSGVAARLRFVGCALAGCLVLAVGLARAETAAASAWARQSLTPPSLTGQQSGVSCPSVSACTAVGHFFSTTGIKVTLAERWTGTKWAIQTTPNPSGATGSGLGGVSCISATACTAVGDYTGATGASETLAERWNGATWTIQATPNPSAATNSSLSSVSCTSNTSCTAVGYFQTSAGTFLTLAERWNGATWAIQATPNPSGATTSVLGGVSCSATAACTAVGHFFNGADGGETLAERWNGTAWTIQTSPNPSGAAASDLTGVSCASISACTAVGSSRNGGIVSLAERWNGVSWTLQGTPNPTGLGIAGLSGVSCKSSTACTAVGYFITSAEVQLTVAERWNGASWTIQTTPDASGGRGGSLASVSCPATSACTGVGGFTNRPIAEVTLAEGWNGTRWATQPTPNPTTTVSSFNGESCKATGACTAVGYFYDGSGTYVTLAERWDESNWTVQTTPNPPSAATSVLTGVSCPALTACIAVGHFTTSGPGTEMMLAERWSATGWTIQTTPSPSGAQSGVLAGVSCTSATACTAVGNYTDGTGATATLAERWNGTAWTIQTTPNPSAATNSGLNGVSCTSATACTAVGYVQNSAGSYATLAEHWDGASWTIQTSPNPIVAKTSVLDSLSCTSNTACTAGGYFITSGATQLMLAERWDGTSWRIQVTPRPTGAKASIVNAVSCTAPTACTIVGGYTDSTGIQVTLAEQWNASGWTIQTTPHPATANRSGLGAVSCTTTSVCSAVGTYFDQAGREVVLAERYS